MPKFHSLRPVYPPRIDAEPREPLATFPTAATENAQDIFNQEIELTDASVTPALSNEPHFQPGITTPRVQVSPLRYKAPQEKAPQLLQSAQALQPHSLLTALQSTMEPKNNRLPIIIPAEMKKRKQQPAAKELSPVTRRTISRFKLGIVSGAMVAFTLLTALSYRPVSQGQPMFPLNNLIQLSQAQGQNSALSQATFQNNAQPATVGMPNVPQSDLMTLAQQDAIKYGISPVYFVRQINAESGFNPNAYSPAGAVGIAQFIPSTAAALGINPYDPVSSLDGAAKYMARLSNLFGGDYAKALAAYNAGSATVNNAVNSAGANWLSLMPAETQAYVNKIMG